MSEAERLETLITARLLRAGRGPGWLSIGLTVAASFALLSGGRFATLSAGVVGAGVIAAYLTARVALDARLFLDASSRSLSIESFDRAMSELRLLKPGKTGRSWTERCRSARRLLIAQAAAVSLQCALAAAAGWPS